MNNSRNINQNVVNSLAEMNKTMEILLDNKLIYFFNEAISYQNQEKRQVITWNNHVPSRLNCGKSFTTLNQYRHLLNTNGYHCILYDGSIIRSSYEFENEKLVYHSHLWWPSPFNINLYLEGVSPLDFLDSFLSSRSWGSMIKMRTPVRIDFDIDNCRENHPLTHMHTQYEECRIGVDYPICFNKFIYYIFKNFYPPAKFKFHKLNCLKYNFEKPKKMSQITTILKIG